MSNEIQQLKQRTISIINTFNLLYPAFKVFRAEEMNIIQSIDENPTNGFHELTIKCQLFRALAARLSEENFTSLPEKAQILIEMLFNPMLESDLIDSYEFDGLNELLKNYTNVDVSIAESNTFWKSAYQRNFDELNTSINTYLDWYNTHKKSLHADETNTITADEKNILSVMPTEADVEQDETQKTTLKKGSFLGTTGLGNCVALIGVQLTQNEPIVQITHASNDFYENMLEIQNSLQQNDYPIGFYLVGGLPIFMHDFLPLIYNNEFTIYDVRLARSITANDNGCVTISNGKSLDIHYSGNLSHQPKSSETYLPCFRPNIVNIHSNPHNHFAHPTKNIGIFKKGAKRKLDDEIKDSTAENTAKYLRKSSD